MPAGWGAGEGGAAGASCRARPGGGASGSSSAGGGAGGAPAQPGSRAGGSGPNADWRCSVADDEVVGIYEYGVEASKPLRQRPELLLLAWVAAAGLAALAASLAVAGAHL